MEPNRLFNSFSSLVAIDSPSYGERQMCDALKRKLASLGFEISEDDAAAKTGGNSGNLYGYLTGDDALEPMLLCAHMDTVEPSSGKAATLLPDGRIVGNGTAVLGADDIAGIAEILEAVARIRESGANHRPIEVLFTIAEEVYGIGAWHFDTTKLKSRVGFVLDLSGAVGEAAQSAPSIISWKAVFIGKSAHAGFDSARGIHAIEAAAYAITKLQMGQVDELSTVNVGEVVGGTATNIVPDRCEVKGEVRSFDQSVALAHIKNIEQIVTDTKNDAVCEFTYAEHIKAYEIAVTSTAAQAFTAAAQKLGLSGTLRKTFGGSDNNHLIAAGIDSIVVANAMRKCHSVEEYTYLSDMETVVNLILEMIK